MARTPLFRYCIRLLKKANHKHHRLAPTPPSLPVKSAQWTRRRFIQSAALAGGTAISTRILAHQRAAWSQSPASTPPTIAIVGGGLAGLNAAYQLKKIDLLSTVYEAKSQVGGRTQSVTGAVGEGLVLDTGGHFINTDHEDMLALADELGLTLFNRNDDAIQSSIRATSYYFDGKLRSEAEVAASMEAIAEQIAADAALLDEDYDQFAPTFDRLSVTAYLDRHADKIPDPFIRVLLEQSIRTEYGVEPAESSALQLLFNLPTVDGNTVEVLASDETYVVEGGIGQMLAGLADTLSGQIQTNRRLTGIQSENRGFRLTFNHREQVWADYVILALPFTVLRQIDIQVELPQTLIRFIKEVDLGTNEKVFAGFDRKFWRQSNGFIQEIWTDREFSQAWEATQRQSDRSDGALTFFVGGNDAVAVQSGTAEFQGRQFINQLADVYPDIQAAANGQFFRTGWAQDPFVRGAYTNFKPGQLTKFADFFYIESDVPEERQNVNVGNLVFAGEHLSDEFYGYMNGAAQTGRLAAEFLVLRQSQQTMQSQ